MKIWRKLSQIGAVPFKGSVYLLPNNEENVEYFQWLVSEVVGRGGEGAFVRVDRVEFMQEKEIIALFNRSREKDYHPLEEAMEIVERGFLSFNGGGGLENRKKLLDDFNRLAKEYELVRKIDFFVSPKGISLEKRIKAVREVIMTFSPGERAKAEKPISQKDRKDYQGRVWVTRKRPFVDRMASAWLIKKYIDPKAVFEFSGEEEAGHSDKGRVTFDLKNGDFTHHLDLCTFEVLIRSFGLKDKALKKLAEIVHQIDLKDEKVNVPEAKGVEEILKGIRKTVRDDQEVLEKGLALFEMLYASKTQ
jgi:hypothetical protein